MKKYIFLIPVLLLSGLVMPNYLYARLTLPVNLYLVNDSLQSASDPEYKFGGIVRTDKTKKNIHLVFTGHEFAEGFEVIKSALDNHNAKASFFFTGDFYRNKNYESLIRKLKDDGHYLGAHSDKHLLYASWEKRDSTLVTNKELIDDVENNYLEMKKFGIEKDDAELFLPPYEWYNREISSWVEELGLVMVNFSPGTSSNQDWSIPELKEKYFSSDTIYNRILSYEETDPHGLNGFILLMHIGTDERRTDKFYNRLDSLLSKLELRGYSFTLISDAINKDKK